MELRTILGVSPEPSTLFEMVLCFFASLLMCCPRLGGPGNSVPTSIAGAYKKHQLYEALET